MQYKRTVFLVGLIALSVYVVGALLGGAPTATTDVAGDVNGDRELDISDAVYLLRHLFVDGPQPVAFADEELRARVAELESAFGMLLQSVDANLERLADRLVPERPRYEFPGDGTVIDHHTDLQWSLDVGDINGDGVGRIGQSEDSATATEAIAFAVDAELAGHTDWRLPLYEESVEVFQSGVMAHRWGTQFFWLGDRVWSEPKKNAFLHVSTGGIDNDNGGPELHFVALVRDVQ